MPDCRPPRHSPAGYPPRQGRMDSRYPRMGRGGRLVSRAAKVALALALVTFPALQADPAGAAALPLVVNDTRDLPGQQRRQRRLRDRRRPLHAARRDPGGQRAARPRHDQRAAGHLRARDPVRQRRPPEHGRPRHRRLGEHRRHRRRPRRSSTAASRSPARRSRRAASTACSRSIRRPATSRSTALTIREGYSEDGGGAIQNWSPGLLRLENVHLLDNLAQKEGGGAQQRRPVRLRVADRLAAADGDDPQRPRRDHRLEAGRQLGRQRRRRDQQRLQRQRHDHRQRGRRQPGPDDPRPGADHRPVRPRAGRVHPGAGRLRAGRQRDRQRGRVRGRRHDPRDRLDARAQLRADRRRRHPQRRATARSRSSTRRSRRTPARATAAASTATAAR